MIVTIIIFFVLIMYAVAAFVLLYGWNKTHNFKTSDTNVAKTAKLSVIVAMRNESKNALKLVECLNNQELDKNLFEVILIDDNSDDGTLSEIEKAKSLYNTLDIKVIDLSLHRKEGKKNAIATGVDISNGELIITTDADCYLPSTWLKTIHDYYIKYKPEMITGPVSFSSKTNLFGKVQAIEFMSLMFITCSTTNIYYPVLANGANIAYTRSLYDKCKGFSSNMKYASGDDMFMMMNARKRLGKKAIRFLKSDKAIVETEAEINFNKFVNQRVRWISKGSGFNAKYVSIAGVSYYFVNLMFFISIFLPFFIKGTIISVVLFWLAKLLIDLIMLYQYASFEKRLNLLAVLPIAELYNVTYLSIIGLLANVRGYVWKGRKIKK
ncbi:MAG: glycosyltransferase [Bacteroidales bacterium]|jgi:cellulose synthase/poly-beta-1,6-N-acetylglucosamine synthase-like glycosyltransferase